jgi:hypothetical protein
MMLTINSDVANGEANGSHIRCKGVRLKTNEKPFLLKLECGTTINGVHASQVKCVLAQHEAKDIVPRDFEVTSEETSFYCQMDMGLGKETVAMRGRQFPIISNSCTTGHKLQGCTVESILANDWHYQANWVYVVLSRVKTMLGLYISEPLSLNLTKYAKPMEMNDMIIKLRDTSWAESLSQEEYKILENIGFHKVDISTPGLDEEDDPY